MELKSYLKSLSVMHLFLVAGLGVFTLLAIYQNQEFNTITSGNQLFLIATPIVALLGYFGSQVIFNKMIKKINYDSRLEEKLKKYQVALHVKYVLIEFPALVGLFTYYNSGNALPLVISICLWVYLFAQKPTKMNLIERIPLTEEEQKQVKQS